MPRQYAQTGNSTISQLLRDLRGGGFNTGLILRGVNITGQKVVAFDDGVVFTVNSAGLARATRISQIDSVDF